VRANEVGLTLVALLLAACSINPAWRILADEGRLASSLIDTGMFRHRVLANNIAGDHLVVYVEGDGTPWIREDRVSIDPTPTNPVMLRLMLPASHPAVYLGRPCYFGLATSPACESRWWTFDRYGRRVVDSMCAAVNDLARSAESVSLVGYSGGGAIVVRMSACTRKLDSVTTIAGNLDADAWTTLHGYTPLVDDPRAVSLPPPGVAETHWQCRTDTNVPPEITDGYFALRPSAVRHIVDDCSHASGWEQVQSQLTAGALSGRR